MTSFDAAELQLFCRQVFERLNVDFDSASIAADAIIRANLEGIDSHGISRLAIYAKRLQEKRINPNPHIKVVKRGAGVLLVDGDNGLGQVVAARAVEEGMVLVKETGVAAIAVKGSNHFGTASYFCQLASSRHLIAIAFTNSPPGIPPWGGVKPFFGTNPIAFGFPTGTDRPVMVDLSTSVVARGKIILAAKQGEAIPAGWAIDERGEMTEDPQDALRGAVLPVGGPKGYALALAIELLTGVLSGAAYGPHVNAIYDDDASAANVGHFFILLDIEKFMPVQRYTQLMQTFLEEVKSVPRAAGVEEILYPGERRAREYEARLTEGIRLSTEVDQELRQLAADLDVAFPSEINKGGKI
ncbi:Ldh family oxidoreductase [Brevibacillus humidisoli]|uniref:Ldh family oxidoreductase n=1 Tax=Brevibacillus humidisoli TaxID=2895522 RepID=UPI001E493C65|nr:Ldh family oxidoreductase [Brevibacillus humidisoli]UFJ38924.1 Ldh family oxidoreductase [Brevibacillus humidisoli]